MTDISDLELDLLTLCYLNSNDRGQVDMVTVSQIAKQKLGVFLPVVPMTLTQKHLDILTAKGIFPDVKVVLTKISNNVSDASSKTKRKPRKKQSPD